MSWEWVHHNTARFPINTLLGGKTTCFDWRLKEPLITAPATSSHYFKWETSIMLQFSDSAESWLIL